MLFIHISDFLFVSSNMGIEGNELEDKEDKYSITKK